MIIKIYDTNHTELHENDVILVRYPNEKIVFLGLLHWIDSACDLVLTDGDDYWISFPVIHAKSMTKVCQLSERPELDKWLGRIHFKTKKEMERFGDRIEGLENCVNENYPAIRPNNQK